jgi:hypothetical protein
MDVYTAFSGKLYRTCPTTICLKAQNNRGGFLGIVPAMALHQVLKAIQGMMTVNFLTNFPVPA